MNMYSDIHKKKLKKILSDTKAINKCAMQCGVMGDETKLKICFLLKNYPELSVAEIANLVGTSPSNSSHSLARLKEAGLVRAKRSGKQKLYSLNFQEYAKFVKFIDVQGATIR
jgi:ArsR family transcriptional regulator, lead/cadmium/zinc/bismuth-responsive transcriptional repressor